MKPLSILLLLLCMAIPIFAQSSISAIEREIWELTNIERVNYGLQALKYDPGLADLARYHSTNMQRHNFTEHKDLEGLDVDGRAQKYYPRLLYNTIGENLARYTNHPLKGIAQDNVRGWMNSTGHRENILSPDYTYLGVGVVIQGNDYLATQNFAAPLVLALQDLPRSVSRKDELVLNFRYLGGEKPAGFMAILSYPDPSTEFVNSAGQIILGAEPIPVNWNGDDTFSVVLHFNAGRGIYHLGFGTTESYLPGYPLKVK